ncbi:MAG TPA: BON domain-containing protein [Terriglobales bacterium]|nr:BON domain-containing protein [Terriglobales bacterium]
MKRNLLLIVSCMALLMSVAAWGQMLGKGHSEADAVKNALKQADLQDVTVSDDADKNTITLRGTVHSEEARTRAAQVAKSAAGNRQIANEVSVQPVGDESHAKAIASNLDDGIENNYKAELLEKHMDNLSIHYQAKNGVLVLTGSVKNGGQRQEAGELAKKVPNVRQVVNQLDVRP